MSKKSVDEKPQPKKKAVRREKPVDKMLIENFVSLQKVMTNLSVKFDELSGKISQLLELFELSAKALVKKEINITKPVDEKKILEQLESILEQNKTIARGLTLVHERISGRAEESAPEIEFKPQAQQPLVPPVPRPTSSMPPSAQRQGGYQKSPFSKDFE